MKEKLKKLKEKLNWVKRMIEYNSFVAVWGTLMVFGLVLIVIDCDFSVSFSQCRSCFMFIGISILLGCAIVPLFLMVIVYIRYRLTERKFKFIERGLCPRCKGKLETELVANPCLIDLESKERGEYLACYNCNKTFVIVEGLYLIVGDLKECSLKIQRRGN